MKPILFALLLLLIGCELPESISPDFVHNTDTTETPIDTVLPIVVLDTCEVLVHIDTPAFTTLTIYFFNGMPLVQEWHIQGQDSTFTDLVGLLEYMYPQYNYTYYENNSAISVIVDGVNNNDLFQGRIWTRDLMQQKALVTAFGQTFYFYGALTYEEALIEAIKRPSVKSFHFTNTNWTPEQNNKYARTILHPELCKHGEYIARFTNALGIEQTVRDSFDLFLWEKVFDLNDDLIVIKA